MKAGVYDVISEENTPARYFFSLHPPPLYKGNNIFPPRAPIPFYCLLISSLLLLLFSFFKEKGVGFCFVFIIFAPAFNGPPPHRKTLLNLFS